MLMVFVAFNCLPENELPAAFAPLLMTPIFRDKGHISEVITIYESFDNYK